MVRMIWVMEGAVHCREPCEWGLGDDGYRGYGSVMGLQQLTKDAKC
jgi:hypothetical protein